MSNGKEPAPKKVRAIPVIEGEWQGKTARFRTDRLVVGLKGPSTLSASAEMKTLCDGLVKALPQKAKVFRYPRRMAVAVFEVPAGSDIPALAAAMAKQQNVRYAEPAFLVEACLAPNDTSFASQWGPKKVGAEAAWDLETGAAGILIGIADSGVATDDAGALNHPDIDDATRYTLGTDFINNDNLPHDDCGHGTHVAGIACAETNNNTGVAGMDWNSPVYICKVFDADGNGDDVALQSAIEEIVDYAEAHNLLAVINFSGRSKVYSEKMRDACSYVNDHHMILCAATGNDHYVNGVGYPARHSVDFGGVIAVGATDSSDTVPDFSNKGPEVTLVAPGKGIYSSMPPYHVNLNDAPYNVAKNYDNMDGTSMASPHVAGAAALVWSRAPRQSNEQVRDVLVNTAVKLGPANFDNAWGYGRLDAAKAVLKAGWDIALETPTLTFLDIPEGETSVRAVRFSVKSFHATSFSITSGPGAHFGAPFATSASLGKTTDYDTPREATIWISFTATTAGAALTDSVTVHCAETDESWAIPITANVIARPTACLMVVLDQSGSMGWDSGVTGKTREQVLQFSAGILADVAAEKNAIGIVSFDQDPHDVLIPPAGPLGPPPVGAHRGDVHTALAGFHHNPNGTTSIGDGIERAHDRLAPVTGYDVEAIIVLTDGQENTPKYIADVAGMINDRVYAVGLGTAEILQPSALNAITNGTGGYLLMTDDLGNNDYYKLAKYFLQIQAGVTNQDIVLDPSGWIAPGPPVKIPFRLTEADISADIIVMLPSKGLVDMKLETPAGALIGPGGIPGATFFEGENVSTFRITLPVSVGGAPAAHAGEWHAILKIRDDQFKRYLGSLDKDRRLYEQAKAHGVFYELLVQSYSNLRMRASLGQTSYEPGATLTLSTALTEYGAPLMGDASVRAIVTQPGGTTQTVTLTQTSPGVFAANTIAAQSGVYSIRVLADGFTARRSRFAREQVVTGSVWAGGDTIPDGAFEARVSSAIDRSICHLVTCLRGSTSAELQKEWEARGFNFAAFRKCCCTPRPLAQEVSRMIERPQQ